MAPRKKRPYGVGKGRYGNPPPNVSRGPSLFQTGRLTPRQAARRTKKRRGRGWL